MTLAQRNIPTSRVLTLKSRSDGEFGVVGQVRMLPGETSAWAIECEGTHLPTGASLYGMSEPTVAGDDAGDIDVTDYTESGTQALFELALDAGAAAGADIEIDITLQPTSDETLLVTVPVTVGS